MTVKERFADYLKMLYTLPQGSMCCLHREGKLFLPNSEEFYISTSYGEYTCRVDIYSTRVKAPMYNIAKLRDKKPSYKTWGYGSHSYFQPLGFCWNNGLYVYIINGSKFMANEHTRVFMFKLGDSEVLGNKLMCELKGYDTKIPDEYICSFNIIKINNI